MHVTLHTNFSFASLPGFIGTAGMCPSIHQRSQTIVMSNNVQSLVIENKQIESDLSYLGMT